MQIPYLNEVKIGVIVVAIVAALWYVVDLRETVLSQKTTIASLEGNIAVQNQAITDAGKAREVLQSKIDEAAGKNKKLAEENKKLKGEIENRPDSKTCEEAMNYLAATAKKVADEWNSK